MPGEITADAVMPLLLDACPSFETAWRRIESENAAEAPGLDRLHYVDAGEFAAHLTELIRSGDTEEFPAVFAVIERLHVNGDNYVRELATIGYLEGIQNVAGNRAIEPARFEPFLGPESARWWRGLNAFWSGQIPLVEPVD